jgi:hypothetical protein
MRRTAYMKSLAEAEKLPTAIESFQSYFQTPLVNPRDYAINAIKKAARLDTEALFDSELIEILQWRPRQTTV